MKAPPLIIRHSSFPLHSVIPPAHPTPTRPLLWIRKAQLSGPKSSPHSRTSLSISRQRVMGRMSRLIPSIMRTKAIARRTRAPACLRRAHGALRWRFAHRTGAHLAFRWQDLYRVKWKWRISSCLIPSYMRARAWESSAQAAERPCLSRSFSRDRSAGGWPLTRDRSEFTSWFGNDVGSLAHTRARNAPVRWFNEIGSGLQIAYDESALDWLYLFVYIGRECFGKSSR